MKNEITYCIDYKIQYCDNSYSVEHTIKVKKCMGDLHAKIKLEEYLKKKTTNFKKLIVLNCTEDVMGDLFGSIFSGIKL